MNPHHIYNVPNLNGKSFIFFLPDYLDTWIYTKFLKNNIRMGVCLILLADPPAFNPMGLETRLKFSYIVGYNPCGVRIMVYESEASWYSLSSNDRLGHLIVDNKNPLVWGGGLCITRAESTRFELVHDYYTITD